MLILYLCQCGRWLISMGLHEALASAQLGGVYTQHCPDCTFVMRMVVKDERLTTMQEKKEA